MKNLLRRIEQLRGSFESVLDWGSKFSKKRLQMILIYKGREGALAPHVGFPSFWETRKNVSKEVVCWVME